MAQLGQIVTGQVDLISVIKGAEFLSAEEKQQYLDLLPRLNPEQVRQVADFFLGAERELKVLRDEHDKKKALMYQNYLGELKQVVKTAQGIVYKAAENYSQKSDENQADNLLTSLNNL